MKKKSRHARRGFTLIELLLAGLITSLVLGSVSISLSQLSTAKNRGRKQLAAHLRADAAIDALRRDVISILRRDDLFFTRLLIIDDAIGDWDRDQILVFNTRLRPTHKIDYTGEGMEYETQYRIEEDQLGPVLWQRRDAVLDKYPRGDCCPGVWSASPGTSQAGRR